MKYLEMNYSKIDELKLKDIPILVISPKSHEEIKKTVIFYHGWESNKERQIFRGNIFASYGYRVIIPGAINHGERISKNLSYDLSLEQDYFYETIIKNIEESKILTDFIKEKYKTDEIAVGGHSMGAITAGGLYSMNKDFKMAFIYNGVNDWDKLLEMFPTKNSELLKFFRKNNPAKHLENFKNRPIAMYNGKDDESIDPKAQRDFSKLLEKQYSDKKLLDFRIFEYTIHIVTTEMLEESIKFSKTFANF